MRKLRIIASYLAMAVAAISLTRADGATVAAPIPIGYATTRITRPLTKNGLVDYVAAFNQRFGKGITPQNNAAVPLLILFRPQSFRGGSYTMAAGKMVYVENKNWGHKFRKALGISDRDLQGPQYIPLQEFLTKADYAAIGTARHLRLSPDYMQSLARRPWAAKANALTAAWLRANGGALDIAAAAFTRSRFFLPIIRERSGQGMFGASGCVAGIINDIDALAINLAKRAMLELHHDQIRRCESDLIAAHRGLILATYEHFLPIVQRGLSHESRLSTVTAADEALAESGKLSSVQALAYLRMLNSLPHPASLSGDERTTQRWFNLDAIERAAENKTQTDLVQLDTLFSHDRKPWQRSTFAVAATRLNSLIDNTVRLLNTPGFLNKQRSLMKMTAGLRNGHKMPRRLVIEMHIGLSSLIAGAARRACGTRIDKLCFALVAYHGNRGKFPARLAELVPKYLPKIPHDPFTGKSFGYALNPAGCTISSPGEFPPQFLTGSQLPYGRPLIVNLSLPPWRAKK